MALIGLSISIQPGNHPGTAPGYIAFGAVIVAVFFLLIVCQLTNRVVVTEQGLTWRNMMRTRSVTWPEIQDVQTVTAASAGPWYSPAIRANGKLIRISSLIGPRRYTESVVTEIRNRWTAAITTTPLGALDDASPAGPPAT